MIEGRWGHVTGAIVKAAYRVHWRLGPGLLESAYEACLAHEVRKRGITVRTQVPLPLVYDEVSLDAGYRLDMLVAEHAVVEIKVVEKIKPVHASQVLSYMRLGRFPAGLLLNFHVHRMEDGIKRFTDE